jgi:DNA-binding NtrC family response regulator
VLVIGRARDADVRIDDLSISRAHARLHVGVPLRIEDLSSANGTRLDGVPLSAGHLYPVRVGAVIGVADVRLVSCAAAEQEPEAYAAMHRAGQLVERVAASNASVLLLGETGAGKEVLAAEIHRRSHRANGPFLCLNCAALPEQLLESELFGYERGAFTGAAQAKTGLLESAAGGTVLLDEVGDLPPAAQAKLLRTLESGEVLRLGGLRPRSVDVRFLSATHRDLDALAVMGQFRQDLLFRLNGVTIRVPPLRNRVPEIPELARDLLSEGCARQGRPQLAISVDAELLLSVYRWPGNVRELRNVLERAMLLCDKGTIDVEHIEFSNAGAPAAASASTVAPQRIEEAPPQDERQRILLALRDCSGNQKEAARKLGITRRALIYRLDKLGLPRPRKPRDE